MNWFELRERIMEDLDCGKRRAMTIEHAFRRMYKGEKQAIQKVCKVWYNDNGRVTFKLVINNKYKAITI